MTFNTKSAASSFLDQLIADPLNPDLCRQFGVEVVPVPAPTPTPAAIDLRDAGYDIVNEED